MHSRTCRRPAVMRGVGSSIATTPRWRSLRHENKYDRMVPFGRALPRIRRQVRRTSAAQP